MKTPPSAKKAASALLLVLAAAVLAFYAFKLKSYENRDIFLCLLFVLLTGCAMYIYPEKPARRYFFLAWFLLFAEFFLRAAVYGRADFFEYTIFEADERRLAYFLESRVNLIPFASIRRLLRLPFSGIFTNIFGNVGLLVPVSLLFPLAFPNVKRKHLASFLSGAALSLSVELLQLYFMCGAFDVDDLILNSVGAAIGASLYALLQAACKRMQ